MENITSITFKRTSNIFVNAGIVGLYKFAQKYQAIYPDNFPTLKIESLGKDELTIHCDKLLEFLEEVYYYMGAELYDTRTTKQINEKSNFYFVKEPFEGKPFSKIKTYGLSVLVTGDPPMTAGKGGEKIKFDKLLKEDEHFALKIADFLEKNGKKLKFYDFANGNLIEKPLKSNGKREENNGGMSEIFLNSGYTTIPKLVFDKIYLTEGEETCPVLGEKFKKLYVKNTSTSAFLSGIANFNSFQSSSDAKISWKAVYILRFSPANAYYSYQNKNSKTEYLVCNIFNSDNLTEISDLYDFGMFRKREELEKNSYGNNFQLYNFKIKNKSNEEKIFNTNIDAKWESEIAIMLLYTFYKKQFEQDIIDEKDEYFAELEKVKISLVNFRANKFAKTLRPGYYEEFNNVRFILRLFYELEANEKITFYTILQGLKLDTPKAKSLKSGRAEKKAQGYAIERQIRANVFSKVLKGKTIIHDIEKLFFDSFKYLIDSKANPGYRSYKKLVTFLLMYEKSINFGNIKNMNAELQQQAVNLGKSVGIKMLALEGGDKRTNAKNGRKYIIRLHKARTQEQFTEALIGIMKKYTLSNKVIETIDKDNFLLMRQYTVIGALNIINGFLSSNNNDNKE